MQEEREDRDSKKEGLLDIICREDPCPQIPPVEGFSSLPFQDGMGERHGTLREGSPVKIHQGFLVFPFTVIGPGCIGLISAQPQVPFRPSRLAVDPACASQVSIVDLRVGKNSFFISCGGAPGTLFPPLPIGLSEQDLARYEQLLSLKIDTCQISQYLSLSVENHSEREVNFRAMFWGLWII